jgi:two-component system response regulator FixJ
MLRDAIVHVIDDDEAIRESLTFLLDTAGLRSSAYDSAEDFLDRLPQGGAGCIVTDVRMPGMSGLDLVQRLRELGSSLPVVVMTGHGDIPLAVEAMKAGAVDFIEKPFDDETMLQSLRTAAVRGVDAGRAGAERAAITARLESLSVRERQVLDALVAGNPNKIIAYDLGISPRTVEVYRANVMSKMQVGSLSELVRMTLAAAGDASV